MAKPLIPKKPIILVVWEDSAQPSGAWQWVDDISPPAVVICHTVGYLVADSAVAISIACSLGDVETERMQANGVMRIPRSAIRKIVDLAISSRAAPREPLRKQQAEQPA